MYRAAVSIFLLATSCSSSCDQRWQARKIATHCAKYNSTRLTLPACNTFNEMEIEISETVSGIRMYGNIRSLPLPSTGDLKSSIIIGSVTSAISVKVFEGGQRVLFPNEIAMQIISALQDGKDVTVSIGRYKAHLIAEYFWKNRI